MRRILIVTLLIPILVQAQWVCGDSLEVNHVAGSVAPVNKTTKYGTISGVPGELGKCWITKNLGADRQALSVSDNTEASSGWYWQFNRKQGYKHDGTTRTPNTVWITSINEEDNWLIANDPCNIELGAQWYLPTNTEWYNVDNTGGWTNWNGPWGSGLKLHAAGYLGTSNGSLYGRGSNGLYWSSTQNSTYYGASLNISSGISSTSSTIKTAGISIRCVKAITFMGSCSDSVFDSRNNRYYHSVQIGTQCWLKENMNIGTHIDASVTQADNAVIERYCYNNDTNMCNVYGGLYQWAEAVQYLSGVTNTTHWITPVPTVVQGICPSGWHLPTKTEWDALSAYLGGTVLAGGKLKSTSTASTSDTTGWFRMPTTMATNTSGFSMLPSGGLDPTYGFINKNAYTNIWTITKGSLANAAYMFGGAYNYTNTLSGQILKVNAIPVRCIKN